MTLARQGLDALQNGDRRGAYDLLIQALKEDATNVAAWIGLADVVATNGERRYCLQQAITLDPTNEEAKRQLAERVCQVGCVNGVLCC
jgi:Tfp pilus assembly protein PilF